MQRDQHTVETVAAQRENGQDSQGLEEAAQRSMVSDQRDVQTSTSEEHGTHVSHTVRTDFQV